MDIILPRNLRECDRGWSIICIEGYCGKDWEYIQKGSPYDYKFDADKEPDEWEQIPNSKYDPNVRIPNDPPYCEKRICYACLENKCPYFAYSDCEKEDEEDLEWMGDELEDYVDVLSECKLEDYVDIFEENVGDYTYE